MSIPKTLVRRTAYELMTLVSPHPKLALPAARFWDHGVPVDADTDIVIEGYPRSGNSLAFATFASAQPEGINIAHHTHAPANVIAGARRGLPILVLVRKPDEAVSEWASIKADLTVAQAMRAYRRFYAPILGLRHRIVIGRFEELAGDLERIVRRVNERFGTDFSIPAGVKLDPAVADEYAAPYWREREGRGLPLVGRGAGGSFSDRHRTRARIEATYRSSSAAPLRRDLADLYERFTGDRR
jgi:hypothetical protein